jgi:beta-glucosidase/6-phospho-beta-glucosidase/beta-galactosidase
MATRPDRARPIHSSERPVTTDVFRSFVLGGFECSTHKLRSGRRLDLIASTRHDELARQDYRLLQRHGILSARDGLRWHLIEQSPYRYDFTTATAMFAAAADTGMQVVWDFWHYGWPDDIDIFSPQFVDRFVAFAREAAARLSEHDPAPYISPINEISFFSWAAGEGGVFFPFAQHRGDEMKRQLVGASIQAIAAMREVNPAIRIFQIDPMINVVPRGPDEPDVRHAEEYRQSQFQAWDMILGRTCPELGGRDDLIDVIGVNYYIHNQFVWQGQMIVPSDPRYRHVSVMLQEVYERYRRPLFVAETGIEDGTRPAWFRYMCKEVLTAMAAGVPVEGVCLYPILNHPGWDDDRHCHNGLFDYADAAGHREAFGPLADEITRRADDVAALRAGATARAELETLDTTALDWAAHVMQERTDESRS